MRFKDKITVITGASSGIGKETAKHFAAEGAVVIIADINEKAGDKVVTEIEATGGRAQFLHCNVADFKSVEKMFAQVVDQHGQLDIAINNAGIGGTPARTDKADLASWDQVMAINTTGVFYCMKVELEQMFKQKSGAIVNISSIAGLRALPSNLAYVASKHAVAGMTKTSAREFARHNIRINAVCPVFTVTPLFDPDTLDSISAGISEKLKAGIPMKRFAHPSEMATAIMFLCSDDSSFITGHMLPVDGGLTT